MEHPRRPVTKTHPHIYSFLLNTLRAQASLHTYKCKWEEGIMWARIVLILGGLTGVFVSEIFDTGVLTLGSSIIVLLVGIFSPGRLTELAGERQRPGTLVAWSTSGAGPRAKPKAPAVGHFLAPDVFHAKGAPSRSPAEGSVALPCGGLPHRVVAPRQEPRIPRRYTRISGLDGTLAPGSAGTETLPGRHRHWPGRRGARPD